MPFLNAEETEDLFWIPSQAEVVELQLELSQAFL